MAAIFCRCEPGRFNENQFYTDPDGKEIHILNDPHFTSTCDEVEDPGPGPGVRLVAKIELFSFLKQEQIESKSRLFTLLKMGTIDMPLLMDNLAPEEIVSILNSVDQIVSQDEPVSHQAARFIIYRVIGEERKDELVSRASEGQEILSDLEHILTENGFHFSNTILNQIASILTGENANAKE